MDKYYTEIISSLAERTIKRLWILCIILALLLVGSWVGFIVYESSYVDEVVTQEVDTGQGDAYVAGIGDIIYGESKADNQKQDAQE